MIYNYSLLAVAGLVVYFVAQHIRARISAAQFSKAHGCEPVHRLPQFERIIGYGIYKHQKTAYQNKNLLEANLKRNLENGSTWSATVMGQTFYSTTDPENIKAILATNFKDFGLGKRLETFGPLLGKGIFTSDGPAWEHSRALVRPNFTRQQVADLDTFESHIQDLISQVPRDSSTFDLCSLFFKLTLDSSTEFLFGESTNSLTSAEDSEQQLFGKAFDFAQKAMNNRTRLGIFKFLHRDTEFDQACKTVHDFVDKIVERALARIPPGYSEKENESEHERYLFIDEIVKATRDPVRIRDELLNILLAGRDTTASLLSHTFHVLVRRPDIYQKLKNEIDELRGKKPDYETLKGLKYLKNLLNESLRLYPVVPGNARFANKNTTIPRGGGPDGLSPVFIPKGCAVAYGVYTMHRRTDIYGPDALEFRPERWNADEGLRPGWGYLPFNGGPRICVGQQFALAEASYTIVRLVQEFGLFENRDPEPWTEQISLTLAPTCVKIGLPK